MTSKNELKLSDLFENYLYLKNIFDNNLAEILLEQNYDNHAINLAENKNLLYLYLVLIL